MSKIKNGGLDQFGARAEPFEQQQLGTAGVEGVNPHPQASLTPSAPRRRLHA